MPSLEADVQRYLHDTLGVVAEIKPWEGTRKLPYFLQDRFQVRELHLLHHRALLALETGPRPPAAGVLRGQLERLQAIAHQPVIYVAHAMASYERKRLIEQKVPFIVPGNQLYLPEIGIDLREYFWQPPPDQATALSPATQALLISALLRQPWDPKWRPAETAAELGYTAMTLSRAVKELTAAGIATVQQTGRARLLHIDRPPAETWEHAKAMLRSPVRRSAWAHRTRALPEAQLPLAGLSALARLTMLSEPSWPIYAVSTAQWSAAMQAGLELLTEPQPTACEWQVWNYKPILVPGSDTVDPLSLTLSLQDQADERIQLALDELKARFSW